MIIVLVEVVFVGGERHDKELLVVDPLEDETQEGFEKGGGLRECDQLCSSIVDLGVVEAVEEHLEELLLQ